MSDHLFVVVGRSGGYRERIYEWNFGEGKRRERGYFFPSLWVRYGGARRVHLLVPVGVEVGEEGEARLVPRADELRSVQAWEDAIELLEEGRERRFRETARAVRRTEHYAPVFSAGGDAEVLVSYFRGWTPIAVRAHLYCVLSEKLLQIVDEEGPLPKFYFDATTGNNYFALTAYEVMKELLGVLAVLEPASSPPVLRLVGSLIVAGESQNEELSVLVPENVGVEPLFPEGFKSRGNLFFADDLVGDLKKLLSRGVVETVDKKELNSVIDGANCLAGLFRGGLAVGALSEVDSYDFSAAERVLGRVKSVMEWSFAREGEKLVSVCHVGENTLKAVRLLAHTRVLGLSYKRFKRRLERKRGVKPVENGFVAFRAIEEFFNSGGLKQKKSFYEERERKHVKCSAKALRKRSREAEGFRVDDGVYRYCRLLDWKAPNSEFNLDEFDRARRKGDREPEWRDVEAHLGMNFYHLLIKLDEGKSEDFRLGWDSGFREAVLKRAKDVFN